MTVLPTRATYREVLAEPRFRILFATRTLAIAADTVRIVALSVLIFAATGSALLGALTFGIGFLPQVVGVAMLGAVADRVRPRRLIVSGYALECATALVLATVPMPVTPSLLLVAAVACLTPVFAGASSRVTAEVLTGDAYVLGRSLTGMAASGAQLVGLAGAGAAVAAVGPRHALLVSAAGHLVAAIAVRFGLPDLARPDAPPTGGGRSAVRHSWMGNRRLLGDRAIRRLLLAQWLPPAFVTAAESLLVPYAAGRGFAASAPGLLLACVPVGMIAGNLVVGRLVHPASRERSVTALVVVLGGPLVAFVAEPPALVTGLLLAVTGTGFAYGLGLQRRFLDALPEPARGQAFGLLSAGLMTAQGVGPAVFGALTEVLPVGTVIGLAGGSTVVTGVVMRRWFRR